MSDLRVARLDSDALAARRGSRASTTTSATAGSTSWSGPSSPRRGSTSRRDLAAVIAADVTLNLPDYLAPERTFRSLPRWPAAPAGDRCPGGCHPDLRRHRTTRSGRRPRLDVDGFADEELLRRRLLGYPPFERPGSTARRRPGPRRAEERGRDAAAAVALRRGGGPRAPAVVRARRAGRYRFQVSCGRRDAARARRRSSACRPAWPSTSTPNRCCRPRRGGKSRSPIRQCDAMANRPILTAEVPILRERTKKVSSYDAGLAAAAG